MSATLAKTSRDAKASGEISLSFSAPPWLSPIVFLLAWELGSRLGWIPARILAAPSTVVQTFWELGASGELATNLLVSLGRVSAGLALGASLGVIFAVISGLSRTGEALVDPLIQMLRTLPIVALTSLFIIWFGIGETAKVALITLGVSFPIYINLFAAIRGVDKRLVEAARSFGLKRGDLIVNVILPAALPGLLVGLRYGLSIAWLLLVVAEQINATAGLGYLINNARDFMRTDIIVACLVIYALLGLGADALVRGLERTALGWRQGFVPS